ncbi:phage terminase large subunit, partial [Bacillus vallismortis]|nr:phage terminase large subunit [Bacillus vallismortis]
QLRFQNVSRIMFKGMDNPAKLKSVHNISLIWIEECSEVKYEGFKELNGRLRHPEQKLHMICTTNPVRTSNRTNRHIFR